MRSGLSIRHRFAPDSEVLAAVLENWFERGLVTSKPENPYLHVSRFAEEPLDLIAPAGESAKRWTDLEYLDFIDHPDGLAMAGRSFSRRFPGEPGVLGLRSADSKTK